MNYSNQTQQTKQQVALGGSAPVSKSPLSEALGRLSFAQDRVSKQIERAYSKFDPVLLPIEPTTSNEGGLVHTSFGVAVDTIIRVAQETAKHADLLESFNDRCSV
jgi:hypothetical protein